ncbi:MAG: T9SS type A sorting domain-containing protein [Bacteroidia bacterium]|nr:T9SS type A sorting domain-containing protein [Bacteroidia bacterium]
MKRIILFTFFFIVIVNYNNAQISHGGLPLSFSLNLKSNIDKVEIKPLAVNYVNNEDLKFPKDGKPPRVGYGLAADLSLNNSGTWTILEDGSKIWQLQIKSQSALALGVYFDLFHLPVGSNLYLYNEDKTQVIGSFNWLNNDESKLFATEMIYGDLVNIEYYEPKEVFSKPEFHINNIAYFYRGVSDYKNPSWTEPSESCEVNVNCSPVGNNWQDEKKGVARIAIQIAGSYYWCSGSLINNTNQDCTPYFLSAFHCYEGATASDLNQWIFYFNYEASGCTTPSNEPSSNTMTGATLKADANIVGGSDLLLLQLNQTVPNSYHAYMNGWNRANSFPGPGVGIHHPAGSIKKISTFTNAATGTYNSATADAHWTLSWVSNSNGWGVTEGGSSGSPLFDANSRIVGTLTGGSSYCTSQTAADYYGKMYYHWDLNSGGSSAQLKTWLDPAGSGVTTLNGKYCDGSGTTPVCATVNLMSSGLYWNSYANGNNSYGDLAKANYFVTTNQQSIQDVEVQFIYAKGTGNATLGIWNNSGSAGSPGSSPIATKTVPISTIISDINASPIRSTSFHFTSPVTLSGPCYVGVILPTNSGDTVVIWADTSVNSSYNVAWERWSIANGGGWYAYNNPSSWNKNVALAIWPVVCTPSAINEIESLPVSVFPNPAKEEIFIVLPYKAGEKVEISLYDIFGKLCKIYNVVSAENEQVRLDLSNLSNGIYILNGKSISVKFIEKITVIR